MLNKGKGQIRGNSEIRKKDKINKKIKHLLDTLIT